MGIKNKYSDISSMSFEKAIENLEKIIENLEQGNISLEESIQICERGEALKRHCEKLLKNAEDKIQKIVLNKDGSIKGLEPIDTKS